MFAILVAGYLAGTRSRDVVPMVAWVGAVQPRPVCDDEWNTEHRSEAPLQRADRNFAELLQELRVAQKVSLNSVSCGRAAWTCS
jgi:hypothetical protein